MSHIFGKMLQIIVSLKNDHLVEENCNYLSQWVYWVNLFEIEFIFSKHQDIATK